MAATDAYTDKAMPWFRKRLINVGSFVIVTEPLGEERARQLIPNNRVVVSSKNIGHYIRITPDNRLAFGGQARFAPSDPASDVKSGDVLKREMTEIFPQMAGVKIDYVWGGMVGFSHDRVPHAGEVNGLYYSMGYCGHGVKMATYMGRAMVEVMDGEGVAGDAGLDGEGHDGQGSVGALGSAGQDAVHCDADAVALVCCSAHGVGSFRVIRLRS
ncbi:hypothetical protein GCM10017771_86770 [Streptomyces capitiformicae]|uniref:FAD dependent oxidoreductase domain-containing protein n=1 Tax=Streptomyces capitiformicae TaxID=2014920 RepID=A0A919DPP7_9ACTN|nr:hypothetical protein GCM10017771_86770 [Streptomyces capitiformicae]